ncbi:GtrA family protein [Variovorax ginsengisoli]
MKSIGFPHGGGGQSSFEQLMRYGLVGLTVNLAGYAVYLLVTYLGAPPRAAMTVLYGVGAFGGFWGNKRLTFRHEGGVLRTATRYVLAHCLGYLINLAIFAVVIDKLGYPHQWAQAIGVFVVAGYLFLAFKFFVFRDLTSSQGAER